MGSESLLTSCLKSAICRIMNAAGNPVKLGGFRMTKSVGQMAGSAGLRDGGISEMDGFRPGWMLGGKPIRRVEVVIDLGLRETLVAARDALRAAIFRDARKIL